MPAQFKVSFPVPREKLANVTVVVDSDTVETDEPGLTVPPEGPEDAEESPAVLINTQSGSGMPTGLPMSLVYPDVQILPIGFSTTGQQDITYRTPTTGVIFTWTEAVNGFTVGDIELVVESDVDGAMASLSNFRGAAGSTSYTAQLNFPTVGSGIVRVRIPPNVAESVATMREGPIGFPSRSFAYSFALGTIDGTPKVEIQLPAANPYVGRTAPIRFLWNIPVVDFGEADVSFTPNTVTMSKPERTTNPNLWEAELTLPSVSSATMVTATVAMNSVTSQEGVLGPVTATSNSFTYDTPGVATRANPAGTTMVCDTEWAIADQPYLSSIGVNGGAVYGITDLTKIGNNLFGVAQVRRRREGRMNELADSLEAGAALFRVNLQTNACTILRAYPSVLEAARSLVEHQSNLYWFEGNGYLYNVGFGCNPINNPRVGTLGFYNITGNCVSSLGKLWRIALGRQQGETFEKDYGICGGMFSPMISTGTKLLALPGAGNTDFINYSVNRRYLFQRRSSPPDAPTGLRYNTNTNEVENLGDWQLAQPPSDENFLGLFEDRVYVQEVEIDARRTPPRVLLVGNVTRLESDDFTAGDAVYGIPTATTGDSVSAEADNWPLISYSTTIEPRIELMRTNGISPWDLLLDYSRMTLTILAFQQGLVFFKPRIPVQAVLTTALTNTATSLDFRYTSISRPFPATGTLVIESEVMDYSSVGANSIGILTRAQDGTPAVAHANGTLFTLVDHVLNEQAFATPIEDVVIDSDATNLYNSIVVQYDNGQKTHRESDSTSIATYGEREFGMSLAFLSRHQNEWVRWAAQHSLNAFKDLQHIIRISLHPRFDIEVGDYVFLNVPRDEIRRIGLVIRVLYNSARSEVNVELRTVTA